MTCQPLLSEKEKRDRRTHHRFGLELARVQHAPLGPGVRQSPLHEVVFVLRANDLAQKKKQTGTS